MPEADRPLRVFLCHSSNDKLAVRELYQRLNAEGWMDVWLDEEKLFPGQDWDLEIEKAVEATDVVIVCLSSNSVSKEGYIQRELRFVLRIATFKPIDEVFVIPIRLDECTPPRQLANYQYVDLFPKDRQDWAYQKIVGSLIIRAENLGLPPIDAAEELARPIDKMYILFAAEDDLALRAEPNIGGFLWKRMLAGTELICLEPKTTAKAKLGVNGQWINVQDPSGDQGYVAAWYVSETKGGPASTSATPSAPRPAGQTPATTTPAAASKPLPAGAMLFVPTQELAFRSRPEIAPETLIRRIPVTEQLISLDSPSFAIERVGVVGKWLKVRDQQGKEGFVAAWYVKSASGVTAQQPPASGSTAVAPAAASTGKVKAAAQAVAFRKQPVVNDSTLIRWLPLGEELTISEPGGEAKVGANNQWLKVKDNGGMEGYVAAWFVAW